MLGVEYEARVEGLGGDPARLLPREHVEEVGGEREILGGRHGRLSAPHAMMGADGGGELAGEPHGLTQVGRVRVVGSVGIMHAQDGHRGLKRAIGIGLLGHEREGLEELVWNGPRCGQLGLEAVELRRVGQLAHPEQIGHFLEGGLACEVVDVITAIGEPAPGAVEIAKLGFGRDHAFETADEVGAFSHA